MNDKRNKISAKIQFLLAGYYDVRVGNLASSDALELAGATRAYAEAVAAKLESCNPTGPEQWLANVRAALTAAKLSVRNRDLPFGGMRGFAEAVADSTAVLVAPRDSDWFRGLEANAIAKLFNQNPPIPKKLRAEMIERWKQGEIACVGILI